MRLYKYLFFLGILVLASCGGNDETVPQDVIQPDRMTNIFAELHQVDGNLYNGNQMPDSLYHNGMGNFVEVFKKYKTDTLGFKKSFTWYTRHPIILDKVYLDVIKVLQARVDSISKIKVPPAPPVQNNQTPVKIPPRQNNTNAPSPK